MAAADQGEAVGMVGIGTARAHGDMLLAGIDQPAVNLVLRRHRSHADQAVFRMEDDFAIHRHMVGDVGGDADTQVDVPALGDVGGQAGGHLLAAKGRPGGARVHFVQHGVLLKLTDRRKERGSPD